MREKIRLHCSAEKHIDAKVTVDFGDGVDKTFPGVSNFSVNDNIAVVSGMEKFLTSKETDYMYNNAMLAFKFWSNDMTYYYSKGPMKLISSRIVKHLPEEELSKLKHPFEIEICGRFVFELEGNFKQVKLDLEIEPKPKKSFWKKMKELIK